MRTTGYIRVTILALVIVSCFYSVYIISNNKNKSIHNFYHLYTNLNENIKLQKNFHSKLYTSFLNDTVYIDVGDDLQSIVNKSIGKTIILKEGIHESLLLKLPSNIKLVIPKRSTLKLSDDIIIDQTSYPEATGDAVIQVHGLENEQISNVFIELNGVIDGNKNIHPYSSGGVEGIDLKWVNNSYIYGNGSIENVNGDAIDIDVSTNIYIEGIKLINNDGGGIHFGSPRPIKSNFINLVIGVDAITNGYLHKRAGLDQSWPNISGVTYYNCHSYSNYQNYDMNGNGAIILKSRSNDNVIPFSNDNVKKAFVDDSYKNLINSKNFIVSETGYYLLSYTTKKNNSDIININDKKIINDYLIYTRDDVTDKIAVILLHKNDIITSENIDNLNLKIIYKTEDIYDYKYQIDIVKWRINSTINKYVYIIYQKIQNLLD